MGNIAVLEANSSSHTQHLENLFSKAKNRVVYIVHSFIMSYQTEEAASILDGGVETITQKKEVGNKYYSIAVLMALCLAVASFRAGHSYGATNATASMIKLHNDLAIVDCSDPASYMGIVDQHCGDSYCFYNIISHHGANFDACPTHNPRDTCNLSIKPGLKSFCLD